MKSRMISLLCSVLILLVLSACGGREVPDAPALPTETSNVQNAESPNQPPSEVPDATDGADIDSTVQETVEPSQAAEVFEQDQPDENSMEATESLPVQTSQPEQSDAPTDETRPDEMEGRVLIAYFTWAENMVVEDPSAVDVDATTSASVLFPGHVAQMAEWIQAETGGDLFSIVTTDTYSSDYDECLDRAADEKADNARPALAGSVTNMADYDVVFLGYPNWWASIPMPIASFLEEYDFSGKTIIPFCSHGGGRFGQSLTAITKLVPDAVLGEGLAVSYSGGAGLADDITDWLVGNNIETN